jgi:hypothetical protein
MKTRRLPALVSAYFGLTRAAWKNNGGGLRRQDDIAFKIKVLIPEEDVPSYFSALGFLYRGSPFSILKCHTHIKVIFIYFYGLATGYLISKYSVSKLNGLHLRICKANFQLIFTKSLSFSLHSRSSFTSVSVSSLASCHLFFLSLLFHFSLFPSLIYYLLFQFVISFSAFI